ncbi:MucR family transcriptional regulator [Qipengyuania flava]|uniref:MucR family transcriptional regulator n=1 Tax=Qipengyuania flava TaxID=192812 RepID=UPI00273D7384|nr:MucR family transcriptional regulator [Qipengyuania flava]
MENTTLVTLTTDITTAYVANHEVETDEVGRLVTSIHDALSSLGKEEADDPGPEPAVSVRASIKKDHIVCLVCGKKLKTLKRHLRVQHDMQPQDYREAYNLSSDYPMIAREYASRRSDLAKEIGLGKQPGQKRGRKAASKSGGSGPDSK